jgi:hypothetical protein
MSAAYVNAFGNVALIRSQSEMDSRYRNDRYLLNREMPKEKSDTLLMVEVGDAS